MAMTEEERKAAHRLSERKFKKEHTTRMTLNLNRNTDADIIAQLDVIRAAGEENPSSYIKRLIREDIDRLMTL